MEPEVSRGTRQWVALCVAVAVGYVLVSLCTVATVRVLGLPVVLTPGVVFALGLLIGPVAAVGSGVGSLLTDLLLGTVSVFSGVDYGTQFVLALGAPILWGRFGRLSTGATPGRPTGSSVVEFSLVAVTVAALVAAITACGAVVFGRSPFTITALDTLLDTLGSILTVGTVLTLLFTELQDRNGSPSWLPSRDWPPARQSSSSVAGLAVLGLSLLWLGTGYGINLLFQGIELENPQLLVNRVGPAIRLVQDLAGPGGRTLQLVVGSTSLIACLAVLYRSSPAGGMRS